LPGPDAATDSFSEVELFEKVHPKQEHPPLPRLVASISLLAERTGLPPGLLRGLYARGIIPAYRPGGRKLVFDVDEVIAAIKRHQAATTPARNATPYSYRPRKPKPPQLRKGAAK
jgi:hypothetical protein